VGHNAFDSYIDLVSDTRDQEGETITNHYHPSYAKSFMQTWLIIERYEGEFGGIQDTASRAGTP